MSVNRHINNSKQEHLETHYDYLKMFGKIGSSGLIDDGELILKRLANKVNK